MAVAREAPFNGRSQRIAAERFGILPDMITMAKGLTSAHVPMGAVVCRDGIYEAFMKGPEHVIELFHGYTYSDHPLAAVAGLATLEAYREEEIGRAHV